MLKVHFTYKVIVKKEEIKENRRSRADGPESVLNYFQKVALLGL